MTDSLVTVENKRFFCFWTVDMNDCSTSEEAGLCKDKDKDKVEDLEIKVILRKDNQNYSMSLEINKVL